MRTIKFRGKRLQNGEWVIGSLLQVSQKECYIVVYNDDGYIRYEVDPETVGQFTGLLDKNGKEIYEGDIIKSKGNFVGIVTWNSKSYFYINQYYNSDIDQEPDCSSLGYMLTVTELYVIGNVYDNEDLLKKE